MSHHLEAELANHVTNTEAELASIRRAITVLRETVPRSTDNVRNIHESSRLADLERKVDDLAKQFHRMIGIMERGFLDAP